MSLFDVAIVGARCAGSPLGMLLARAGLRVLLVDKATFPSDTLSTHMVHESGVSRLLQWDRGLVDQIAASGCPPLARSMTDTGPFAYGAEHLPIDGNDVGYCPRRKVLDALLVRAAVESGCEVRTDVSFQDVVREGERVVGIRIEMPDGRVVVERARFVVGADGRRSVVAEAVGARTYDTRPATTCTYYTYWADTEIDCTIISPRKNRVVVAVPTNDRLVVITAIFPIAEFPTIKADIERHYLAALATSSAVSDRMTRARKAERFYGTADLPFHYRTAFGPGWALVGDAGHCKDPILARGIRDAFDDLDGLSGALVRGLGGAVALDTALADWARSRDTRTADMYEFTYRLSLLKDASPLMSRVYELARENGRIGSRFHGVISGALPYRGFFVSNDADEVIRVNS